MIAINILLISGFLSITWGIYLVSTIREYMALRVQKQVSRREIVIAFRRIVTISCLWFICFAYVFRTFLVLIGLGDVLTGQITFYALLGTNISGSIFAIVSLRYD